jgi:hypothetical protein
VPVTAYRIRRVLTPLLIGTGLVAGCQLDELLRAPPDDQREDSDSGVAVRLAFTVQPAGARREGQITPPVQVTALDAQGNPATSFSGTITLELSNNPGDATLSGITGRTAQNGVAVFPGLVLDEAGSGYRLAASGASLAPATSVAFDVSDLDPDDILEVSGNGQSDRVTATLAPYVVRVTDRTGQPLAGIEVRWSAGAEAGALNPPISVSNVAGEAGTVHTLGTEAGAYTVTASAAALPGKSVEFTSRARSGPAAQLEFTQQPTDTERRERILPPVLVTVQDAFGNTVVDFNGTVSVSITPGTGTPGAHLDGTRNRQPSNGVARFDNLSVREAGLSYRLRATAPGNLLRDSSPFQVWLLSDDDDDLALDASWSSGPVGPRSWPVP